MSQIERDAQRKLLIQDTNVKDIKGENLRGHLVEQFGNHDAENLIKHFDQGLPYLISGAVSRGTFVGESIMDQPIGIKQADDFTQNIFSIAGIVYRGVTSKYLKIWVYEDAHNPEWKFKVNLKILSQITEDGFDLHYIGTDSAFICATLMQQSNFSILEKMIHCILKYENELQIICDNPSEIKSENQPINAQAFMISINEFKEGLITFDQLAEKIHSIAEQAQAIANKRSIFSRLSISPPKNKSGDLIKTVLNFDKELSTLKREMDEAASVYHVDHTQQRKPQQNHHRRKSTQ